MSTAPDTANSSLVTSITSASSPVTLSEAAANRVIDHMARKDDVEGLRGVKIIVDAKSVIAVAGTEIDYGLSDDGLSETFQFKNPNVTGACGCGESFSVS